MEKYVPVYIHTADGLVALKYRLMDRAKPYREFRFAVFPEDDVSGMLNDDPALRQITERVYRYSHYDNDPDGQPGFHYKEVVE